MIKLFASDLDDTLLNDHVTDEIVLGAIDKIIDAGRSFAVATGRTMYRTQAENMGFYGRNIYFIVMSGAQIRDSNWNILYQKKLDSGFIKRFVSNFPDLYVEFAGVEKKFFMQSKEDYLHHAKNDMNRNQKLFNNFIPYMTEHAVFDMPIEKILKEDILKINFTADKNSDAIYNFLHEESDTVADFPFRENWCELTDISVNKGNAVKFLANKLGVRDDEIAVFGDSKNDVPMLELFSNSFVPENALDVAKNVASEIVASSSEYGVPKKIEELLKIS